MKSNELLINDDEDKFMKKLENMGGELDGPLYMTKAD